MLHLVANMARCQPIENSIQQQGSGMPWVCEGIRMWLDTVYGVKEMEAC